MKILIKHFVQKTQKRTFVLMSFIALTVCAFAQVTSLSSPSNIMVVKSDNYQGITVKWDGATDAGITYDLMYSFDGSARIDTIAGITGTSVYFPYSDLNNGLYTFYVRKKYAGIASTWSELPPVNVVDMRDATANPSACPEIAFNTDLRDPISNLKITEVDCSDIDANATYTIHPRIGTTGGRIAGYTVMSVPFDPPFPIGLPSGQNEIPFPANGQLVAGQAYKMFTNAADDTWSGAINLPFSFCFFQNTYNKAVLGANGIISFNPHAQGSNCPWNLQYSPNIPSTSFNPNGDNVFNSIFGVYEDIYPVSLGYGQGIYAGILGEYPCRTLTVSFKDIPLFRNTTQRNSYQMVLYEGSNVIDVYVQHRERANSGWNNQIGIIGLINSNGTDGIAAPGRNTLSAPWQILTNSQREGWRFVPITTPAPYDVTWYKGAGINGQILGHDDTFDIQQGDGNDTITVRLQFTACNGDYLDLRDTTIFKWTNKNLYTHSIKDTICYGESVTYRDQIFNTTGVYPFRYTYLVSGCDSLRDTLFLTVHPPVSFSVNVQDAMTGPYSGALFITGIPVGGYYTINGVQNAATTNLPAGSYTIIAYNQYGCQSMPQTVEIITDCVSVDINPIPEVCADDPQLSIPYTITKGLSRFYSLKFDAKAQATGFTNIINKPFTPINNTLSYFDVPLPANVRPGNYQVTVKFEDYGCRDTIGQTLDFAILYPSSIITQRWNDVLSLLNNNFNGGYAFSSYEWYKNDVQIPNENGSYLYVGANGDMLDFTAEYRAKLTRVDDGLTLFTCPLVPEYTSNAYLMLYPTVARPNQQITIVAEDCKRATLWTVLGLQIAEYQLKNGTNKINAPAVVGTYILKIENNNGEIRNVRILVK